MHTQSDYAGRTAYCYPEQGLVNRLLRVHMQSSAGLWPWMTLDYDTHTIHRSHACMRAMAVGYDRLSTSFSL